MLATSSALHNRGDDINAIRRGSACFAERRGDIRPRNWLGGLMTVAIGIPVWNRKSLVTAHAASLRESALPDDAKVLVIDDASSEFGPDFLSSIFPPGSEIRRNAVNSGGADFALRGLVSALLETGADALMVLDSDLLVRSEFLSTGLNLLGQTDGMLSLFNTPNHATVRSAGALVVKDSVGAAGTLWRRELAELVHRDVSPGGNYDWRFCDYLRSTGREIYVTKESWVQHIGLHNGQNSNLEVADFGVDFADSDARNAYRLIAGNVDHLLAIGRLLAEVARTQSAMKMRFEDHARASKEGADGLREEIDALRGDRDEARRRLDEVTAFTSGLERRLLDAEASAGERIATLDQRLRLAERNLARLPTFRLKRALKIARRWLRGAAR